MAEKEDIIFQIKVEGSDALTEMERFKKSIVQTKQEQAELTKAYKAGNITLNEFVKEQVRLEAILKKQQSSYNTLQKSVTGVKTQMDKLIDSNKKISKSFQDTAGQINIAGQNVGALTTRLASFANPATLTVALVGALGTAYARSTVGAKDLSFAQSQLSAALQLSTNKFAELFSSAEDGEGILSRFTDAFISRFISVGLAVDSRNFALAIEKLEDLNREEIEVRDKVNQRLEENEELMTEIQSDQVDLNDKIFKGFQIVDNIRKNEEKLLEVLGKEVGVMEEQLALDQHNEALQTAVLLKKKEIGAVEREAEKRVQRILKLQQNLNDAEAKRLKALQDAEDKKLQSKLKFTPGKGTEADALQAETDFQDFIFGVQVNQADREIRLEEQTEAEKTAIEKREAAKRKLITQAESDAKVTAAVTVLDSIAGLASEGTEIQKAAALLSIATSTTAAVTKGIEASQSIPFPGNLVAMATTIATILGAIANAKQIGGFAEGGWTGPGDRNRPAGIVHADEYVTPKHIVHAPAAQHHLTALENMRLRGYADGGLVTNALTSETNQNLVIANMLKRMPAPVLDLQETSYGLNKLKVKVVGDKPAVR